MIPFLGIPVVNRGDLLLRCVKSIDTTVDQLCIINNGSDPGVTTAIKQIAEIAKESPYINGFRSFSQPNAGCAGTWNQFIKLFPCQWWMIVGNDIQFSPGDLTKMTIFAQNNAHDTGAMFGNHGFSFFIVTRYGVRKVGLFDENIHPAYLEDCDWHYRAHLAGVKTQNVPDVKAIHGEAPSWGSMTIHSDTNLRHVNGRTHSNNFIYYKKKWGGINGDEKFTHPFNDPNLPVCHWAFDVDFRAQQQWPT